MLSDNVVRTDPISPCTAVGTYGTKASAVMIKLRLMIPDML